MSHEISRTDWDICLTQQDLCTLAVDMGFDEEDFIPKYMLSDFCKLEMDAPYSFFHRADPAYTMSVLLDEIQPQKADMHYEYHVIEWIGCTYKYLQLRLRIPSRDVYRIVPFGKMLRYHAGTCTEDTEYFAEILQERYGKEIKECRQ